MIGARWSLFLLATVTALASCGRQDVPPAAPRPLVLVAIGASDAVGIGASDPARTGWVPQVHQQMPAGTQLRNLGQPGARIADAIVSQLPVALAASPDYVLIWLAVNDFLAGTPLSAYERDLDFLLRSLSEGTRAQVFIATIPHLGALPALAGRDQQQLARRVEEWNGVIARVAAANGAVVVDLARAWRDLAFSPDYVSADGFHPSDAGHRRIAELFWEAMGAPAPSAR
ncbi:MAG: GDSL-type esterase/lipase family protein [Chloroflexota bacterium]|nr:GDSL-type esterase/lipase family protein [Dehalococcoidia bacterium]MDW8254350.1 GDSL-type esterase/lipase family protein [Chloroflexota bacterium]